MTEPVRPDSRGHTARPDAPGMAEPGYSYDDFYAYLPTHGYLHAPTHEIWPAASVNAKLPCRAESRRRLKPSHWLDLHRPVMQLVWMPGAPSLIHDRVMQDAGWEDHPGACLYNLYTPPAALPGSAALATPWLDHLQRLYPADAGHLVSWLAHEVQHPGVKINHALLLGGAPGIGKDTLLEPVRAAVGGHNFVDISPRIMQGRFNGWVRNVIVRVSEVRDLGEIDRYAFYEHCKPLLAAPPDALRVDEKNLREYYVANACGLIFTTNHLTDGLYLPADDRRHFVAWSEADGARLQRGLLARAVGMVWRRRLRPRRRVAAQARPFRLRPEGPAAEDHRILDRGAVGRGA